MMSKDNSSPKNLWLSSENCNVFYSSLTCQFGFFSLAVLQFHYVFLELKQIELKLNILVSGSTTFFRSGITSYFFFIIDDTMWAFFKNRKLVCLWKMISSHSPDLFLVCYFKDRIWNFFHKVTLIALNLHAIFLLTWRASHGCPIGWPQTLFICVKIQLFDFTSFTL